MIFSCAHRLANYIAPISPRRVKDAISPITKDVRVEIISRCVKSICIAKSHRGVFKTARDSYTLHVRRGMCKLSSRQDARQNLVAASLVLPIDLKGALVGNTTSRVFVIWAHQTHVQVSNCVCAYTNRGTYDLHVERENMSSESFAESRNCKNGSLLKIHALK